VQGFTASDVRLGVQKDVCNWNYLTLTCKLVQCLCESFDISFVCTSVRTTATSENSIVVNNNNNNNNNNKLHPEKYKDRQVTTDPLLLSAIQQVSCTATLANEVMSTYVYEDLRFWACYCSVISLTLPEISEELLGVHFVEEGSFTMFRNKETKNKYTTK
jgi:hypothetical protein